MSDLSDLLDRARRRRALPSPRARRLLRERAGLTQDELALVVGVSPAAISRWEAGLRQPRRRSVDAYADVLAALAEDARRKEVVRNN
jgi:transcriptional regulator with XRE-family HTH domain